jgi:hypothetical protein
MSAFIRFALVAFFALLAFPAFAVQPQGSAAWTNEGWTNLESSLFTGPGHQYHEIGTVGGGLKIRVVRCTGPWCEIRAKNLHGWMSLVNISFGQGPWRLFDNTPRFPIHYGGGVCFYSGTNYTGTESCFNGGHAVQDLALIGRDNSFRSVKVGSGSVMACRDRNFRSYCVIINKDEKHIEGLLSGAITSIRPY